MSGLRAPRIGPGRAAAAVAAVTVVTALTGAAGQAQAVTHQVATNQAGGHLSAARQAAPAGAGMISTVDGGAGGPAKATMVSVTPCAAAPAGPGELYVVDENPQGGGNLVREVAMATDGLSTPAGTAADGPLGLGGPATSADWQGGGACGVTPGPGGSLIFSDAEQNRVLMVPGRSGRYFGQTMIAGDIYSIAGTGTAGFSGDGGLATGAELSAPIGVAADAAGNVLFADAGNERVRVVAASSGTFYGRAMKTGHIYTIAGNGSTGRGGDGGPPTKAQLTSPTFVSVTSTGNVVINTRGFKRFRVVAASTGTFYGQPMTGGDIYTVGGDTADYSAFSPMTVDSAGNIVAAAIGFAPEPDIVQVVASTTGTFYGQPMTAGGTYTIAGNGSFGFSGDGGPATQAELGQPLGVGLDSAGNVVIADTGNNRIRVIAESSGTFYQQPMTAGDIYTVGGNGNYRRSGAAGPATGAQLQQPQAVALDAKGDTLIADTGNNRIMVTAAATGTLFGRPVTAGHIYDEAGTGVGSYSGDGGPGYLEDLKAPADVTADSAGDLVIADAGNNRIRVVAARAGTLFGKAVKTGRIYTVAGDGTNGYSGDGGPAVSAALSTPQGAAVDGAGNLVIADGGNSRVRVVAASTGTFYGQAMTAGDIYTVVGGGDFHFGGDGGPATAAGIQPQDVAVDHNGNLLIADTQNHRIRVVAASTGTFYGQAMTAGDIYTVAGDGTQGFSGDGGPATGAELSWPGGVAADGPSFLIADSGTVNADNSRIREVTG